MTPIKAIRQHCLECCGGSAQVVKFCTCDGVNCTRCDLWPYRFGKRPQTAAKIYGERFLDPNQMPSAEFSQEECQAGERPTAGAAELSQKSGTRLCTGAAAGPAARQESGQFFIATSEKRCRRQR